MIDDGPRSSQFNMFMDSENLKAMTKGLLKNPTARLFQWEKSVISFGYLLDSRKVKDWARDLGGVGVVQRPTGGGAVLHQTTDLSLSLLWPRHQNIFSEKPRDCYEEIHKQIKPALDKAFPQQDLHFYTKESEGCLQTPESNQKAHFSICFDEPVCNDIMRGPKKIWGGALRITKKAILYQGNLILSPSLSLEATKTLLRSSLS